MRLKPFLFLCAFAACSAASAQVSFAGSYNQNFDTLLPTGSANPWTDNVTLPGWYAKASVAGPVTTYAASTGTSTTGALYSFGSTGSTDRSLGSVGSNAAGDFRYGVRLLNATGATIDLLDVAFTGEQWRNGGNATAQSLSMDYLVGATAVDSPGYNLNALTFTGPVATATAGALDGNAAANRRALSKTLANLGWGAGQSLWIRFYDPNDSGNDHGLALDDFSVRSAVNPTPEPGAFAALGVGALALLRRRRRA